MLLRKDPYENENRLAESVDEEKGTAVITPVVFADEKGLGVGLDDGVIDENGIFDGVADENEKGLADGVAVEKGTAVLTPVEKGLDDGVADENGIFDGVADVKGLVKGLVDVFAEKRVAVKGGLG